MTKMKLLLLAVGIAACTAIWATAMPPIHKNVILAAATPATAPSQPVAVPPTTAPLPISVQPVNSTLNLSTDLGKLDAKTPEYVILQPIDEATFSSETTASVEFLPINEGSYFKAGDTLLTLDCRVQKAELQKALAQQTATSVALKSATRLKSYDSISEYEVIKARAEAGMADAEVSKLGAIVDKCIIKAPFNGAVADLYVHAHETVKPGDPLMKIVNTDRIIIELEVPSTWLQWLHIGSTFNVHVNEINQTIIARVVRINPKIEPVSQTVKIVGEIEDNTNKLLLPGMSGQASFPDDPARKMMKRTK